MDFFIMVQSLSLCLIGYGVMRTGRFKKFPEVVFGQPSLPLEVTFDSRYEPLTGAVDFLTAVAVAGQYGNATGSALLSLLATHTAFPSAFDGGLGGHDSASVGGRSRVT
jgi:hypothetical protein